LEGGKDWGKKRRKRARKEKWRGRKGREGRGKGGREWKVNPLPNKNSGYGLVARCLSVQTPVHHHTEFVFNPLGNIQPMELVV